MNNYTGHIYFEKNEISAIIFLSKLNLHSAKVYKLMQTEYKTLYNKLQYYNIPLKKALMFINYNINEISEICPVCGKNKKRLSLGCTNKCSQLHPSVKKYKEEYFLNNYGVSNPFQYKKVKEKIKKTNLEKYGVEHHLKNSDILQKQKHTNKIKYGTENVSKNRNIIKKIYNTNLKNHNGKHSSSLLETKTKTKTTNKIKYGHDHWTHNKELYENKKKNNFKYKSYYTINGNEVKYQGYENIALNILFLDYEENDIITDNKIIPKIHYIYNEKNKIHYPDIFIKSENKIIEVKSEWTFKQNKEECLLKQIFAKKENYLYEIWVCSKTKLLYKL